MVNGSLFTSNLRTIQQHENVEHARICFVWLSMQRIEKKPCALAYIIIIIIIVTVHRPYESTTELNEHELRQ